MASTGKCPYCGSTVRSDEIKCPSCGAANENYVVDMPRTVFNPKTIDELKEYCAERGMPLLRMRFFIGEDYREPKAFGIYRDGENFVVYKNKSDGSRSVRYRGPDEAFAVNELLQKLLEECHNRGIYPDGKPTQQQKGAKKKGKKWKWWYLLLYPLLIVSLPAIPYLLYTVFFLVIAGGAVVLVDFLLRKLIYKGTGWPAKRLEKEQGIGLEEPIRREEYLAYIDNNLRYGKCYSLSTRERMAAKKVGWIPAALRILVSALIVAGIALSIRGIVHRNDGFYRDSRGQIYYQYGSDWRYTGGWDDDDSLYIEDSGAYYYLGDDWDSDWGDRTYEPPTIWEDVQDSYASFSESVANSSSSDSSSSGWDSWDSSDTDWDSDW